MMVSCVRPLFLLLVLAAGLIGPASAATDFPNRTVRIVVGFAPGGTTDLLARIVADHLRVVWNTSVLVDNRPGADGIIATTAVHQAPADGNTLLMSTNAIVITPHLKSLPYDPIADFEPITIVGREYHHMMVTPSLPASSVQEFIALAKSTPGGLTFSSAGPGSAPFLGMQRFMQAAGIPSMVHVPYPGSMPAVLALVTGDVQSMFSSPSTTLAARPRRQSAPAGGGQSDARSQRAGGADPGGVRPAGVRKQHLVRADGVRRRRRPMSWRRSAPMSAAPCAIRW